MLAEVGIADALIAYEAAEGLTLIDGHLRADLDPETKWPVLVVDLTEEEADKILATLDPLAALAEYDAKRLDALLGQVQTNSDALRSVLAKLAENAGLYAETWQGVEAESADGIADYDPADETFVLKIKDVKAADRDAVLGLVTQALESHGGGYTCKAF